ncbi:MAG: heparinase II/III family protein, partial [Gammaproteobacteria bacterium]
DIDQSVYGGSFLWLRDYSCRINGYSDDGNRVKVEASHDGYLRLKDPLIHKRKVQFDRETRTIVVEETFECRKLHKCTVLWHLSPRCKLYQNGGHITVSSGELQLSCELSGPDLVARVVCGQEDPPLGWHSASFYHKEATNVIVAEATVSAGSMVRSVFRLRSGERTSFVEAFPS